MSGYQALTEPLCPVSPFGGSPLQGQTRGTAPGSGHGCLPFPGEDGTARAPPHVCRHCTGGHAFRWRQPLPGGRAPRLSRYRPSTSSITGCPSSRGSQAVEPRGRFPARRPRGHPVSAPHPCARVEGGSTAGRSRSARKSDQALAHAASISSANSSGSVPVAARTIIASSSFSVCSLRVSGAKKDASRPCPATTCEMAMECV
jgi:hypothetical protein